MLVKPDKKITVEGTLGDAMTRIARKLVSEFPFTHKKNDKEARCFWQSASLGGRKRVLTS